MFDQTQVRTVKKNEGHGIDLANRVATLAVNGISNSLTALPVAQCTGREGDEIEQASHYSSSKSLANTGMTSVS